MLDLTSTNFRLRDLRKIIEPCLHEVEWQREIDSSEWVHIENTSLLKNWVSNLPIKSSEPVIVTDKSWSKSAIHDWQFVNANLLGLKEDGFSLFISQHKLWVIEVNLIGVARIGFWR
ncbi:hypothetical protein LHL20_20650 [Alteromonas sp. McT4-15]|uniref:hypothetical protein n=1 Tax=Alteromonas sp. McT4-15 TaxID=2881256 RepID=UPI001CF8589A|nr:hypothetical protein [Alteromonas sp. McT4-15]MCB4438633.1 hypothetical protein [Alteromonas sp. McT4-15]